MCSFIKYNHTCMTNEIRSAKILQRAYRAKRMRFKLHEMYIVALAERQRKEEHRRLLVGSRFRLAVFL